MFLKSLKAFASSPVRPHRKKTDETEIGIHRIRREQIQRPLNYACKCKKLETKKKDRRRRNNKRKLYFHAAILAVVLLLDASKYARIIIIIIIFIISIAA